MNNENQQNDVPPVIAPDIYPSTEVGAEQQEVAAAPVPVPQPLVYGSIDPIGSVTGARSAVSYVQATKKPTKWRYFFIVLGILQGLGVALYFGIMFWAMQQARSGVSGTEFIGLFIFITLVPAVGAVALINLVGLPIYMFKQRPKKAGLVFAVVSLLISFVLVSYAVYTAFQLYVVLPGAMSQRATESHAKALEYEAERAKASYEITKEEAISLLKECKLKGFYYTSQNDKNAGGWGELSTTGVVVTEVKGAPYRISIADRLIPELVPIARGVQAACGGPQFWHDGNYEQKQPDGSWR